MNKCHQCNAKAYKPVIERDAEGAMRPSGVYQCVGCKVLFTSIQEWRTGQLAHALVPSPDATVADQSVAVAPG